MESTPVDQIVGPSTCAAMQAIAAARACVIVRGTFVFQGGLLRKVRRTELRPLVSRQLLFLREILLSPQSYWNGRPVYRRLPPRPDFLIECESASISWPIAVDLTNPGWEIHCEGESYSAFHFAGAPLRSLAKELFPEFASPRKDAMWAKGAFHSPGMEPHES